MKQYRIIVALAFGAVNAFIGFRSPGASVAKVLLASFALAGLVYLSTHFTTRSRQRQKKLPNGADQIPRPPVGGWANPSRSQKFAKKLGVNLSSLGMFFKRRR